MNKKGILYVISAPSGCGKGTILPAVFGGRNDVFYSVSATTRGPREGEQDGVNYFFISKEKFKELITGGEMLEYAEYCGNMYGTPKAPVTEKLENGTDVVLEIETKGAKQVKERFPDAVLVFILPPSVKELRRRLEKRGTESAEVIEQRVGEAVEEIKNAVFYDYIMVNDDLEKAIEDFKVIIEAAKLEKSKNVNLIDEVLKNA